MCHDTQYPLLCYQRLVQSVSELQKVILGILVVPVLAHCLLFLRIFCRFLERVTSHFFLNDKRCTYIFSNAGSAERGNRLFSREVAWLFDPDF